jgi:general secretion pathway protein A
MLSSSSRLSKDMTPEFEIGQSSSNRYKSIFHFFGLRENPFHICPDPRYLSFSRQTQEAFDALTYGIQTNQGLMLLTGEVGTGKTTITNYLLDWLRQRQIPTSFIFNPRLNVDDLFEFLLADFGVSCKSNQQASKPAVLTEWLLARYVIGKTPILIVDEAHGLPLRVLEEIRLLLNLETPRGKLLQIVLVGQPELEEKLRRPELRQLRQRVMVHCKIRPLNSVETRVYIHRRMKLAGAQGESVFLPDAINAVHFFSNGIPRVINILCEHALINAYAGQVRQVSPQIVKEVGEEFQIDRIGPTDTRLDFAENTSTRSTTTRSISTILRVHSLEATELATTEYRNAQIKRAPLTVVDKNPAAPATVVPNSVEIANPDIEHRVAPSWRWMLLFSPILNQWRLWRDKSIAVPGLLVLRHAASSVIGWLQQPVRPVHARRRIIQGHGSTLLHCQIVFAKVQGEIRKAIARLWRDAIARLES